MRLLNRYAFVILLPALMGGTASGATPTASGLGQSWPNIPVVSSSAHFHVYAFQKQGVRYLQINDAAGTVRGAIALIGARP